MLTIRFAALDIKFPPAGYTRLDCPEPAASLALVTLSIGLDRVGMLPGSR
jgi:hypothetical protein